jgi:hypothetical protein
MLLAEALAARKDAIKTVDDLQGRLAAAVLRYEDQVSPVDDPDQILAQLAEALDRFESLSVRINRTNNETRITIDAREVSIMEAIALRERLLMEAKARRGAVEAVEQATGSGKAGRGRGWLSGRRTKDDIRELPTVELGVERQAANKLSETVRRLDLLLQQRNWTTDLVE